MTSVQATAVQATSVQATSVQATSVQATLIQALVDALQNETRPVLVLGERRFSGRQITAEAARLRERLLALGVGANVRVALLCPNHPAFVVVELAVLSLGAALLPLNPLYHPSELAERLTDAAPVLLVSFGPCREIAERAISRLPASARPGHLTVEDPGLSSELADLFRANMARLSPAPSLEAPGPSAPSLPPSHRLSWEAGPLLAVGKVSASSPAVLIYTSGTTGRPRAAILTHGQLVSNGRYVARTWYGGDDAEPHWKAPREGQCPRDARHRVLAVRPLCHNFGLNVSLHACLLHGGTVVLLPRFSAVEGLRAIERHGITAAPLVPTMVQSMLLNRERQRVTCHTLRLVVSGGAALPRAVREGLKQWLPEVATRDTYGLSEASLVTCTHPWEVGNLGTVGRPIDDTVVTVVRSDGGRCVVGEVGEIRIRGPGVMTGYWRVSEGLSTPFLDGWLMTGDLGFVDQEGNLTIVDRKKDMIVRGGYKVYPAEVEAVLFGHGSVADAAVFGVPDRRMGEAVVAMVTLREEGAISVRDLVCFCRARLTEYKVPGQLVICGDLPQSPTGKILRRVARDEYLARSRMY